MPDVVERSRTTFTVAGLEPLAAQGQGAKLVDAIAVGPP